MEAGAATRTLAGRRRSRVEAFVREAGEIGAFSARATLALRGAVFHFSEVLRQGAILVLGTTLIVALIGAIGGGECSLIGNFALRSIGAQSLIGAFNVSCGLRNSVPILFGYIFAAKVGCGLVAEIGSMRIGEEIDALESVGIDPMRYVVGTRLAGALIALPFIATLALFAQTIGTYLVVVVQLGEVSQGAWETVYWGVQDPLGNLYVVLETMAVGAAIVLVGLYYGYRARGGPVGVGAATARSMIVNIVLVHVITALATVLLYMGTQNAGYPFGG
jgi:phospholipid/cholesterol/gamma-HCH transport system permease protein